VSDDFSVMLCHYSSATCCMDAALQGLVGLVTGAGSGLGRATAERFAREGAKVVVCDLPNSAGKEVADQLGSTAVFSPTDVRELIQYMRLIL